MHQPKLMITTTITGFVLATFAVLISPEAAHAYGGPGSVISAVGTLLAAVAAVAALLLGFIWFPLKRLVRRLKVGSEDGEVMETASRE